MGEIILIFLFLCLFFAIILFILVLLGYLPAMKWLARHGVAVFSKRIDQDSKLLYYVNPKESFCWLSIPEVCYCPIMHDINGKYKNHNFLQKENLYGEVYISESIRDKNLLSLSDGSKDNKIFNDLSIIKGNSKGNGTDLRHANFSQLRLLKKYIKETKKNCITFCKNGYILKYSPVALIDISVGDKHFFEYNNRENFLESFLSMSQVKNINKIPSNNIIFLECRTDIDIVIVMLEEGVK